MLVWVCCSSARYSSSNKPPTFKISCAMSGCCSKLRLMAAGMAWRVFLHRPICSCTKMVMPRRLRTSLRLVLMLSRMPSCCTKRSSMRLRSLRLLKFSKRCNSCFSSSLVNRNTRRSLSGLCSSASRPQLQAPGGHSVRMGKTRTVDVPTNLDDLKPEFAISLSY